MDYCRGARFVLNIGVIFAVAVIEVFKVVLYLLFKMFAHGWAYGDWSEIFRVRSLAFPLINKRDRIFSPDVGKVTTVKTPSANFLEIVAVVFVAA